MTINAHAIVSLAQPYVEGLAEKRLRYQHCESCAGAQTFAHDACQFCGAETLSWRTSSGRGRVHAVTVVARAPSDYFRSLAPYTLVVVTLDEGARVMGHAAAGIQIGHAVIATFFKHLDQTLVRFEPHP
ncbi:MAG: DNA-binding protein [Alcaligenaceae bacterium]|nr:MAG: DNA-binding protein [Alcaligenaceae bacterium]